MNFKPENSERHKTNYIKSAHRRLELAKVAIEMGNWTDSVSRSYYAFLDAACAGLVSRDVIPQSHRATIKLFGLHFIKTRLVDKKYNRWFEQILRDRIDADYRFIYREFAKEDAENAYTRAEEFVKVIEKLLHA